MMPTEHLRVTKTSRFRKPLRWAVVTIVSLSLIVTFLLLAQSPPQGISLSSITVAGNRVSLSDYRGHVVMLNFWATWCPPCQAEMPVIENAFEAYRNRGFVVLAVNNAERADQVDRFATQLKLTFPILLDYSADIQEQFGIKGYPTSFFIDPQGKLYATHNGMVSQEQLQAYIETGLKRSV